MIPKNYYCYKQSPIWTQKNIPQDLQEKHNNQAGIYSEINIISGSLDYSELNEDGSTVSIKTLTPSNHGFIQPEIRYSIKAVGEVKMFIEYFKPKDESLVKSQDDFIAKYDKEPHVEVFNLLNYISGKGKKALDVGCGGGRNSILLAEHGFSVTSIDRNIQALMNINMISKQEKLDITTQRVDLNTHIISEKYDCIISTVVLQFLEKHSGKNMISQMQEATEVGGYNLIITPINASDTNCPIDFFPFLPVEGELQESYKNWEIIESNEMLGKFQRKDELGNKIISRFAYILAKKV